MAKHVISVEESQEAVNHLRVLAPQGSTIYTVLHHVSKSGMQREISLYSIVNGKPVWLDRFISHLLGIKLGKHEGLVRRGCGLDLGYDLVHSLSCALYDNGNRLNHVWL